MLKHGLKNAKSFDRLIERYISHTMFLLRMLSLTYHTYFGHLGWNTGEECWYYNSKFDKRKLIYALERGAKIFDDEDNTICSRSKFEEDKEYYIYGRCYEIPDSLTIIPYKTVIITQSGDGWYNGKPKEWYNKSSTRGAFWQNGDHLPYLNTRKYIKVNTPFEKVTVSSKIKGDYLTIDDVLFATRALAMDETRTVGDDKSYKTLKNTNNILVLEANIDNFST